MEFINVIVAAIASFALGAAWYMILAKPWMEVSGVELGEDGNPKDAGNPMPFILGLISAVLVAGMMRHVFAASGVTTIGDGIISGAGIGLFFISPWMMMNYAFAGRPFKLTIIDGGYATCGCALQGLILTLF